MLLNKAKVTLTPFQSLEWYNGDSNSDGSNSCSSNHNNILLYVTLSTVISCPVIDFLLRCCLDFLSCYLGPLFLVLVVNVVVWVKAVASSQKRQQQADYIEGIGLTLVKSFYLSLLIPFFTFAPIALQWRHSCVIAKLARS